MKIAPYVISFILAVLLSGCSGEPSTEPATSAVEETSARSYQLPFRGTVTLTVPASWTEQVRQAPGGLATSVEYRPAGGDAFRVAINIRWSLQGDPAFNGPDRIANVLADTVAALQGTHDANELVPETVAGPQAHGSMIRVTHLPDHLIEGKFTRRLQAVLAVDDLFVGAVLVSTEIDAELERVFTETVTGIARLRASGLGEGPAGPNLVDGTLTNAGARYTMTVPAGWSLRETSNAQLMMLDRAQGPATFSVLLKPAGGDVAVEFDLLARGMRGRPGVEIVDERGHDVGGLPGIRMESRATVGATAFSTRNYVTVFGGMSYYLGVETADEVQDEAFREVEEMVASMRFAAQDASP